MRKRRVSSASPHPLPPFRASLCRSAASGHLVRARAPLAPPPPRRVSRPPARPPGVGMGFCRETLGGRLLVRCWPRPGPLGRGGASVFPPPWPPGWGGNSEMARVSVDLGEPRGNDKRVLGPRPEFPTCEFSFPEAGRKSKRVAFRGHTLSLSFLPSAGAELGFPALSG